MKEQIKRIRDAYNLTFQQFQNEIDPFEDLPKDFIESAEFREFMNENRGECYSGAPDIKAYLNPQPGQKHLDLGCAASLYTYKLFKWDSEYYGVDISDQLILAMKKFVEKAGIKIGGLFNTEINNLPFDENCFDLVTVIGVLEYCSLEYNEQVLLELHRVVKPGGRLVLDIPNEEHKHYSTMLKLESLLNRPIIPFHIKDFENILIKDFSINNINSNYVMKKYFLENKV